MKKEPRILGAIYDFSGYLTTRSPEFQIGASMPPDTIIKHLEGWTLIRAVDLNDEDISYWIDHWNDDDKKLRDEYQVLDEAWNEYIKTKEKYLFLRKLITGDDNRKI